LGIAPANVLQGAVRLHGLASSPTPETHVRVACACASRELPEDEGYKGRRYETDRLHIFLAESFV